MKNKNSAQLKKELDAYKLSCKIEDNLQLFLNNLLQGDDTIKVREFYNNKLKTRFAVIFVNGMTNSELVNKDIIYPILKAEDEYYEPLFEYINKSVLRACDIEVKSKVEDILEGLLYGDCILLIDGYDKVVIADTKGWESRTITEPQGETILTGPREGFTESILKNISMLRRKINNKDLKFEFLTIGSRTNTKIAITYIDGLCNEHVLNELRNRLKKIDVDSVLSTAKIGEYVEDMPKSLFRQVGRTERPDVVALNLLGGRIAILCDGTPAAITMPFLFKEYFMTNEDYYNHFIYSSFYRFLRFIAFFLGTSTPAIYVAAITFHRELIPTKLAMSIYLARDGVPFPTTLECFLMLLVFEIIKEAGIRLPKYIGPAISIVGALVLGDAAVKARFVSNPMIIVIAVTELSALILYYMQESLLILKFAFLFLASMMGIYGYVLGVMLMFVHLCTIKSFGINYMSGFMSFDKEKMKDFMVRYPWWKLTKRTDVIAEDEIKIANNKLKGEEENDQD